MPIHDLIVKGVDLVVATHGRSFWILDDLTPLYQLSAVPDDATSHLFPPRPALRLRRYRDRLATEPTEPGIVHYGHAGSSQILYVVEPNADGGTETIIFNAGTNPPDGVVVHYFLRQPPRGELTIAFLDAAGNEIRAFSSADERPTARPPARSGINRFVWNLDTPDRRWSAPVICTRGSGKMALWWSPGTTWCG